MSHFIQPGSGQRYLRRIRLALVCVSIAANAICAGGVFTFPLISPALVTHLKLTQPQLTTIALAGMMGQYPFAALVGKVIDDYGPWACSLVSACLFSAGFGLFSSEISKTPDDITQPSASSFHHLTLYFFIAALGTVFSYFSSVFAASKNFPDYIGIAAGTSMALFGLSPTFLSILASTYYSNPDTGLDVTRFLRFLAILCGCVHVIGAFTMRPIEELPEPIPTDAEEQAEVSERTSLLPNKTNATPDSQGAPVADAEIKTQSALDVLKDRHFWALAFVVFIILGSCEMIISNIGTIVLSLPRETSPITVINAIPPSDTATSTQVRMISLANTISRLVVGPLADIVSPVTSHLPPGSQGSFRKHLISRIAFLTFSAAVLVFTYIWMVVGVETQGAVWALSIGAGTAYGCAFTVLPSLVSSVWGIENLGRNYGIITYAPFLGTPAFSYLYAFVAAGHSPAEGSVCKGVECWQLTFEVSTVATIVALGATLYLWRVWKGKV
ncbi:MFS general substrate transporter [Phlebopus sp. FC_14]|nr:MFS general substrate transporter [Phlebopus sp. FC_14]